MSHDLDQTLEAAAQRYFQLILNKHARPVDPANPSTDAPSPLDSASDYHQVDVNCVEAQHARSIGGETLALHALQQLQLDQKLTALGFNGVDRAAATGSIVARMVSPGSERHTHRWLNHTSCLGELLGVDYGKLSLTRLYTVSDKLLDHQATLESFLSDREQTLFNLQRHIVLYDLTNTYFEGRCHSNPQAQFGRSKEKRSDCPLVTLGLVLDGEGFPLTSQVFSGNASEPATLETMITELREKRHFSDDKPVIIMDAGLASEGNVNWLKERNYHYLTVSRERVKLDPREQIDAVMVREQAQNKVTVYSETDTETQETRIHCHSEQKAKKEEAIRNRFHVRLEEALTSLHAGLGKKGTTKNYAKILQKIGRLREKNSRVSGDYQIDVKPDEQKKNAIAIQWQRLPASEQKDRHSGVYCLRTNIPDWSEQQLWCTYVMLTEIEATFKSLKTELGLRPVYHQKQTRVTAHLFISLLAYHLVHTIRYQLKQQGIHLSWDSIRKIMATQQRLTVSMPTVEDKTINLRTTTKAEPCHKQIYDALGAKYDPIGKIKLIIDNKKSVVPSGLP